MTTPDEFIDYDLIVELIKYIHLNSDFGSILIFLPGYEEIMRCNESVVESNLPLSDFRIFFLHSSMNMREQCDVFKSLPDQRKIILSTNIAETSITVEDVVFVIDVGKAKEKVYDSVRLLFQILWLFNSETCCSTTSCLPYKPSGYRALAPNNDRAGLDVCNPEFVFACIRNNVSITCLRIVYLKYSEFL